MKQLFNLFAAIVVILMITVSISQSQGIESKNTDSKLDIGVESTGLLQTLYQENQSNTLADVPPGLQSAVANMFFDANIVDGIDVSFELYLSSKHHEGYVMDREGHIYLSYLPDKVNILGLNRLFRYIDVKAGHFEIDFGNWHLVRSDNGEVQRNPLIGNYIVDANTVEPALEIIGHFGFLDWVAGVSTGTTTGDFKEDRGTAIHGKVWSDSLGLFGVAGSFYRVDHSDNPTGYPQNGSYSSLFAGNRSGGRYSGILGGGPEPGQIKPGNGQDVTAWQLDASINLNPLHISGLYGVTKDADINGSASGEMAEEWRYYGVEAKYNVSPSFYAAARYNAAEANELEGVDSEGIVNRIQLGVGFWVTQDMLFKLEYVNQQYNDFTNIYQDDPKFYGLLSEISVAF